MDLPAEGAEIAFTAFAAQPTSDQVPGRLIVRRIPDFQADKHRPTRHRHQLTIRRHPRPDRLTVEHPGSKASDSDTPLIPRPGPDHRTRSASKNLGGLRSRSTSRSTSTPTPPLGATPRRHPSAPPLGAAARGGPVPDLQPPVEHRQPATFDSAGTLAEPSDRESRSAVVRERHTSATDLPREWPSRSSAGHANLPVVKRTATAAR